ncbi:MAG: hypothetical protein FJX46_16755 [Alphaproteobacteria bacterium]|nr:hypothetical protein [Alphaproteobacteria bacterium]
MRVWFGILVAAALAGCASAPPSERYRQSEVGGLVRTTPAVVLAVREVQVQGFEREGIGGIVAATAGGVAGSALGSGRRAHILGAIGGAVVGYVLGDLVEKGVGQPALEYVVRADPDQVFTIVQPAEARFEIGQKVLMQMGNRVRLIADPGISPRN